MSFNKRLFSTDDFTPKKRNGKRKRNGNGRATSGFEAPGFFSGLRGIGDVGVGTREGVGQGLQIPALGDDFNTRFGKIGTGFVENVDTFKVGFKDVTTGNTRTGQIIGGGLGTGRKRGRPKGSGKRRASGVSSLLSGGKKQMKGIKIGKAVVGGKEGKTVAQILGSKVIEKTDSKFRQGVSGLKRRAEGTPVGFSSESVDLGEGEGRGMTITQEREGVSFREEPEEGGVTFAGRSEEEEQVEAIEESTNGEGFGEPLPEEDEEEALDEGMEEEEFGVIEDEDDDGLPRGKGGFVI